MGNTHARPDRCAARRIGAWSALLACLLLLAGCLPGTLFPKRPTEFVETFEPETFQLEVPSGWRLYSPSAPINITPDIDLDAELLGVLIDTSSVVKTKYGSVYLTSASILRKPIPDGATLEDVYRSSNERVVLAYPKEVREATVSFLGQQALERTYPYYHGEPRYDVCDLWLEHDGYAYILSFRTRYSTKVNLDAPGFQAIRDSFAFR